MQTQTAVFTKLVRDYMGSPPPLAQASNTCGEVVQLFQRPGVSVVLIIEEDSRLVGIVTEQDVCRRIAYVRDALQPVADAMTTPVKVVQADSYLYHAIANMRRSQLRHMPVVDQNGQVVGVLQLQQALAAAESQMMEQIEALTHGETVEGMKKTKDAQVKVALELQEDAVPAPDIQTLITSINNDLYHRIVELCIGNMREEGMDAPPVEFDTIVMGSGGRGESFLFPDQDNGFILADYQDEQHRHIDPWFIELAQRMTDALNETGFVYCKGYVMATNPLWRKSVSQWQQQTSLWISKGAGMVLRLADIFFDFVPVYGTGDLTGRLRQHITRTATDPFFLREMFKFDQEHEVALGPFNRLLRDKVAGPHQGKINLKLTGTLPLVGAVRISALANGISATSTLARIRELRLKGKLSSDEQDYLSHAFKHITNLLLRQQLRDYRNGNEVGNHVAVSDLSKREKDMLVDSLKAIKTFRKNLRLELTGDLF